MEPIEKHEWYAKAKNYWDNVQGDVNGMLGGYSEIAEIETEQSSKLLQRFIENGMLHPGTACDCGAGIGRVTKNLLLKHFANVDLVEQTSKFLDEAASEFLNLGLDSRVNFIPIGLQDFSPEHNRYDLIWCQWVLSHLTDEDLVAFLIKCKNSMTGGLIGIKENTAFHGTLHDAMDSSVMRSDYLFKELFDKARLSLLREEVQQGFPKDLYVVKLYILQ